MARRQPTSEILDQAPPHDTEIERLVLGFLVLYGGRAQYQEDIDATFKKLDEGDFHSHGYKQLYGLLKATHLSGDPIHKGTLTAMARKAGLGAADIAEIVMSIPDAAFPWNADYYCRTLRRLRERRATINTAVEAIQRSYGGSDEVWLKSVKRLGLLADWIAKG